LGSNGQLGSAITKKLSLTEFKVVGLSKSELDITNKSSVRATLNRIKPAFLINCAAWTDVANAETYKKSADEINCKSLIEITKSCADFQIKLIHISTDHVFSGDKNILYRIDSEKKPVNYYGYSKSMGEDIIINNKKIEFWILRTSWLYGNSNNDFVSKIINQYKVSNFPIKVVSDQCGHPTFVNDLAERIIQLINSAIVPGVYHASNSGLTSWYEFAREISIGFDLDPNKITPIETKDFASNVNRPMNVSLDFSRWGEVNLPPLRNWKIALQDFIKERKADV
jgi:dTDP-4-dehydrorhamnose reductase